MRRTPTHVCNSDYLICCEENTSVQNSLPRCQSFLGGCKSNGDVFYRRKWGECFMHVHVDARMSCRSEQIPSSALLKPSIWNWLVTIRLFSNESAGHEMMTKTNIMPSAQKKPPLLTGIILSVINSWLLFYARRNCKDLYRPACCSRFVVVSCEWIAFCGFYSSATTDRSSTAKETQQCISDKSTCCVCPCKTPWDHARAFWEDAKW